jgi:hypothetical protein
MRVSDDDILLLLLQLTASQNFSSQRLNALDDAIERLRKDFDTKQDNSIQNMNNLSMRIGELDEKLFNLDKELLRIKLILPASAFADKHHPLTGAVVGGISGSGSCSSSNRQDHSSILEINKKLQEISLDIEAL